MNVLNLGIAKKLANASAGLMAMGLMTASSLVATTEAHAKVVGHYSVDVAVGNSGGMLVDLGSMLTGWNCHSNASLNYTEDEVNYRGELTTVTENSNFNWVNYSNYMGQPGFHSTFTRTARNQNPRLVVTLSETCEQTGQSLLPRNTSSRRGRYDDNGESGQQTRRESITMNWACDFSQFPESQGQYLESVCQPQSSTWHFAPSVEGVLMSAARNKTFQARIRLDGMQERYAYNNCNPNDPNQNRFIIQVGQGLDRHVGEDDFALFVRIDGRQEVRLNSSTGFFNEDISYCAPAGQQAVRVDVRGVEEDLIFDDAYVPAQRGSITMTREAPNNATNVVLRRRTYFGNLFTSVTSNVSLRVFSSPQQ